MALAGLAVLDFAVRGEAEALFGARFRLQFGHFASPEAALRPQSRCKPPRHALTPGGFFKRGRGYTRGGRICKRKPDRREPRAMTLPRPLLHKARVAAAILFWPTLLLVIWGEIF